MKTKISEIAESIETELLFRTAIDGIKEGIVNNNVTKVIIDLNLPNALDIVKEVKKDHNVKFIGFLSHVQTDLKKLAEELGVEAMPRSVFFEKLSEIMYG